MSNQLRQRVLWLTNLPAPYRFPIWDNISKSHDLKVVFLLKEKNWRNWSVPKNAKWAFQYLSLKSKNFGEFDFVPSVFGAKGLLQQIDVFILGGWETPFYIRTLIIAKRKHIPVIKFYESTLDSHRFNNILIRKIRSTILSKADLIITSGTASTNAVKAMGIAPEKITTLFNPVDVSWFHSFAQNHRIPATTSHQYIYVSQLIERKNVATVIKAFASIRNSSDTLTIAGDGPLAQELKNLAVTLGLSDSVIFAGHKNQEELAQLYAASNTLILASTNEVWGLVVNEALASGLHVVVSDKCGVAEFVKDMKGAYISSTDQQSIQLMMEKSRGEWSGYIQDPEILQFTPERFADGVLEVIASALQTIQTATQKIDLTWLTNIPTPYRIPIWKVLDSRINFQLIFLNKTERYRDWDMFESLKVINHLYANQRPTYTGNLQPIYWNFYKTINLLRKSESKSIYIDGWESPAFFVTALYAKRKNIKLIYGYRNTIDSHRFNNILIRKIRSTILSKADLIITSGTASTNAVKAMGIAPEKITTLFNPVDVSWFHSFAQNHRIPATTSHQYIYVSQLIERKNVATVIKAFASIRNSSDTLTIAGDGPLAQELKNLAVTLGLSDSVIFAGHKNQEELAQLYAASNTLILASTNEVWGLVVNEALASGLHVVVSDKCGVAEFVKDMKGAYISSTDQQSIQLMMEKSRGEWSGYIQDPEILQFTPERFADGVLEVIASALQTI